ncbi:TlpA family protein disulfide reductase [bacterium]|nr:TlpA family protein disulfide reductase [bacterium]
MTTQPNPPQLKAISLKSVLLPGLVAIGLVAAVLTAMKYLLPAHRDHLFPGKTPSAARGIQVGGVLPEFSFKNLQGESFPVSDLKNKLTILNFWASWCDACIVEVPSLVKLRYEYRDRGLEILGINLDENPDDIVPFLVKRLGIEYPVFVDPSGEIAGLLEVGAIPHTVVFDSDRKILLIETGERDWFDSEIRTLVEKWLKE